MGLFDDEFYSTKVPRRESWRRKDRYLPGKLPGWIFPAAGGAVVTALLFLVFSHGSGSPINKSQAVNIMIPSPGTGMGGADSPHPVYDPVVAAAAKVSPTIVSIMGSKKAASQSGLNEGTIGLGSGIMFARAGNKVRIVTNNHVVEGFGQLDVITVTGDRLTANLVGSDQIADLAVLEVDGSGIKELAELGNSDALQAGETVIALGNPLGLGYSPTVTKGIISWPKRTIQVALGRESELDWEMELIQTDAAINQGNSGGALVNMEGKVIGINTLKVADTGVEGLGFAIPINQAKPIIDTLITEHKIKRPYMGIITQDLQSYTGTESLKLPKEVKKGIIVLEAAGPAKDAGLKGNDVIVELDGKPVESTLLLRKYIYGSKQIGDKIAVTYYRGAKKNTVQLTLTELKDR